MSLPYLSIIDIKGATIAAAEAALTASDTSRRPRFLVFHCLFDSSVDLAPMSTTFGTFSASGFLRSSERAGTGGVETSLLPSLPSFMTAPVEPTPTGEILPKLGRSQLCCYWADCLEERGGARMATLLPRCLARKKDGSSFVGTHAAFVQILWVEGG
jgi:hypothetical protein